MTLAQKIDLASDMITSLKSEMGEVTNIPNERRIHYAILEMLDFQMTLLKRYFANL